MRSDPETIWARFSAMPCDWTAAVTVLMTKHLYEKGRGEQESERQVEVSRWNFCVNIRSRVPVILGGVWISEDGHDSRGTVWATSSQSGRRFWD